MMISRHIMKMFSRVPVAPAAAAALLLASTSAFGAAITFSTGGTACSGGLCSSIENAHTITFDDAVSGPYVDGLATFSYDGAGSPFLSGSLTSHYAAPPNDNTGYLSVGSPGRANTVYVDFARGIDYYGFYLGSPDSYNSISFYSKASDQNPIATFSGMDLIPPGNGNQSIGEYVNFSVTGGRVEHIVLTSFTPALESDNHAYASPVPEPASFGLAGLGLALAIGARRLRKASARS